VYQSATIEAMLLLQGSTSVKLRAIIKCMTRTIEFAPEEFYHIYNHGTEKRKIFMSRDDYRRFLALMYLANQTEPTELKLQGRTPEEIDEPRKGKRLVDIVAYCLMPNHFHLLIRELEDGGISKFMQKLTTGYTMYFNKRTERNGSLFQGRFKASHVADDRYLRYLISYIHLNPIKLIETSWKETGIKNKSDAEQYLDTYTYSSYLDYLGNQRTENMILSKEAAPEYFSSGSDFKTFTTEWLTHGSE
jgi:putative transposase